MSKSLVMVEARRGQPKPTVHCPWSKRAKNNRIRELQQLEQSLPVDEVLVHEDEVDIHFNPKLGPDWFGALADRLDMVHGQQKQASHLAAMKSATSPEHGMPGLAN